MRERSAADSHGSSRKRWYVGAGAIGMLSTYLLRLTGLEVWTASRESSSDDRSALVAASPARATSRHAKRHFSRLAKTSAASTSSWRRPATPRSWPTAWACSAATALRAYSGSTPGCEPSSSTARVGVDAIIENRVLFGSVNAQRQDWLAAVEALDRARERWPDALEAFVGLAHRSTASRMRSTTGA